MPDYTPVLGLPKPLGPDPIRGNPVDNLRTDIVDLADAMEREGVKRDATTVQVTDTRLPKRSAGTLVFVAADANDLQTWLGANSYDLGPSAFAQRILQLYYGVNTVRDEQSIFSVIFDDHMRTDLTLDTEHGVIADWVMDRWAPRIAERINTGAGAVGDQMLIDGAWVPAFTNTRDAYMFSSSTGQALAPYLESVFKGASLHNEGKGGERGQHTAARLGSTPALLTVTGGSIPASGAVVVTSTNVPPSQYLKPFAGTLNGVPGTLSSTDTVMTFARTTAGAAAAVPAGTAFIPELAPAAGTGILLLDFCKNNIYDTGYNVPALAAQLLDAAVGFHKPVIKRLVVLTQFVDSNQSVGSVGYTNVQGINAHRRTAYGPFVYDLDAYILSPKVWIDAGIPPTSTDLQQQADGIKPDSLSADLYHLNAAGNSAVAKDFARWALERGW